MSIGDFVKSVVKLWVVAMLSAIVVLGAFSVGYLMRAAHGQSAPPLSGGERAALPTTSDATREPAEFAVFWEAWQFIEQRFYGETPSTQERVHGAIRGMVNAFGDPNTAFIDPTRARIFRDDTSGSFEGIGAAEIGRAHV